MDLPTSDKKKCEVTEQWKKQEHRHIRKQRRPLVTGPTGHKKYSIV